MMINSIFRQFNLWILLALPLILTTSCSYLQTRELRQKREQWASQKIANYQYTIKLVAFNADGGKPVLIEVRDGKQVSMKCVGCELKQPETFTKLDTIEKLFETIEKGIENNENSLEIKYDKSLGYPLYWRGEMKKEATDNWWKYEISNFEVIG